MKVVTRRGTAHIHEPRVAAPLPDYDVDRSESIPGAGSASRQRRPAAAAVYIFHF